jgi:large subunit ribosomal protein L2
MEVSAGPDAPIRPGCALPLAKIPLGTFIHNVELTPGRGAQLVRSAGTQAQLIGRSRSSTSTSSSIGSSSSPSSSQLQTSSSSYSIVRLPSGEVRQIHNTCVATIGRVSNSLHNNVKLGKAGAKRHLGRRPKVCGVNMNAVDHPHGGGKSRHGPGRPNVSIYGVLAKGGVTRSKRNPSSAFIVTTRKQAKRRR